MSDVIKGALKKLVELDAPMDRGKVLSVDKNAYTCVVELVGSEAVLDPVLLKPIINEDNAQALGLVIFPAVNSFVTVGQLEGDDTDVFVISFTQIESISLDTATALKLLLTGDGNISLNAGKITFNNGNNGGIPLLNPLAGIILKIQQQVNQLITTFNTHIHPVAGASTGPTTMPGPALTTPTIKPSDIENKAIVQ